MTGFDFTAKSGNVAYVRLVGRTRQSVAIDVGWDTAPSTADVSECDAEFQRRSGIPELKSMTVDDPDQRDDIIARELAVQAAKENRN